MNDKFTNSPDYIAIDTILLQKGDFKFDEILTELEASILSFFDGIEELKNFIKKKLLTLQDFGLVVYTGGIYYVT